MMKYMVLIGIAVSAAVLSSGCLFLAAGAGTAGVRELTDKSLVYAADIAQAEKAVRKALKDMGAVVKETVREEDKGGDVTLRGKTFDDTPLTIDMEPNSPKSTEIEIRVGRIGSKSKAKDMHAAIQRYIKLRPGQDD